MGGRARWLGTIAIVLTLAGALAGIMAGRAAAQTLSPRDVEYAVESAFLADPITFPYDLRAVVKNGVLEVHGVVPNTVVRKQIVNIAKLHAKSVSDFTEIGPAKTKAYVNLPPETVTAGVRNAIARGLPQLKQAIEASSDGDGRVLLTGSVQTAAEKQRAAELLRSVPGCLLVNNKLVVAGIGAIPAAPASPVSNDSTRMLAERIAAAAPKAKNLAVYQTGPRQYQITFNATSEIEAQQLAGRIFEIPESKQFKLDIGARYPTNK